MSFQSGIASVLDRGRKSGLSHSPECAEVQSLISLYMDAETSPAETTRVKNHLGQCEVCRQEQDSLSQARNFLAAAEPVAAPENLALESRIRLSRVRHSEFSNYRLRINFLLADFVKPLAIRAVLSASVTAVLFGVMLIGLLSHQTLMASDTARFHSLHQPVRLTDSAKLWIEATATDSPAPAEPLLIQAYVNESGLAYDYRVIEGTWTPEVDRWVWERLYYAQFTPATSFGVPVSSSILLANFQFQQGVAKRDRP